EGDLRPDDAAVAFAAEDGVVLAHGGDDVGLADGGAHDARAVAGGDIVDHAAGGKIGAEGDGARGPAVVLDVAGRAFRALRRGEAEFEEGHGGEGEGVFLADVVAAFIDGGGPGGVGVLAAADVRPPAPPTPPAPPPAAACADGVAERGEVFARGFGCVGEDAGVVAADVVEGAAEAVHEELRAADAGGVDGV